MSPHRRLPNESGLTMKAATNNYRGPSQAEGLTLIETLLALVIACVIGAAILAMFYFTSYATSTQVNAQDLLVEGQFVADRVSEAIQRSKMVLASGSSYLVLWSADRNGNDAPDLSELRRIEYSPSDHSIVMYKAPDDLATEVTYSLASTDFNAVTSALRGSASLPGLVWAEASSWSTLLDNGDVRQARYIAWRIGLTADHDSETVIGGAALRN